MRRPLSAACAVLAAVIALAVRVDAAPPHGKPVAVSGKPVAVSGKPAAVPSETHAATKTGQLAKSPAKPGVAKTPTSTKTPTAKHPKGDANGANSAARGELAAQDNVLRRRVAGGPSGEDVALGAESLELKTLRDAEKELFLPTAPASGFWPADLASPVRHDGAPRVHGSGFAPAQESASEAAAAVRGGHDVSFLAQLQPLDVATRWDDRLVRYLEFFKDDPRGRATMTVFLRKSGRYRDRMRQVFAAKGVPTDLIWLSMIESGFDPFARSPVGAAGLFQFMPETGKAYGLHQDAWLDQRFAPGPAAAAAADFLLDLKQRFGTWDLALASYNMGYGGVLSVVKRYNTNDFWNLSKLEGSLPWETTLYVPKIYAAAIVAKNARLFGFDDSAVDAPLSGESVTVPPGTSLAEVARLTGVTNREMETLNPELRAGRTPPGAPYLLQVPTGKAATLAALAKKTQDSKNEKGASYTVRAGETLATVADTFGVPLAELLAANGFAKDKTVVAGTTITLPKSAKAIPDATPVFAVARDANATGKPAEGAARTKGAEALAQGQERVVVPPETFVYPDRERVFYKVISGDRLDGVAKAFAVSAAEVARWNALDPQGRLQEGMILQVFVPAGTALAGVVHKKLADVVPVAAGTDAFFAAFDPKGRTRIVVAAKKDETLESVAHRYRVTPALAERINRRPRKDVLRLGEPVVLYVDDGAQKGDLPTTESATTATPVSAPRPLPPMTAPPHPELLPPMPNRST